MARNLFINPANGDQYAWTINHNEEEAVGLKRNIEHTAPTAAGSDPGIGPVRQEGSPDPLTLVLRGKILNVSQHEAFITWMTLSRTQSIWFRDFEGNEYEVLITGYLPTRNRAVRNSRGTTEASRLYTISYELTMDVLTVRAGFWEGMAA